MRLHTVGAAFLTATLMLTPMIVAAAAPEQQARFDQVLGLMNKNGNRMIEQPELAAFLLAQIESLKQRLAKVGLVVTQQNDEALTKVVERQATLIINGPAGSGQGVTEARLGAFEDAELDAPFGGKMKDLLPPPPSAPVPPVPPLLSDERAGDRKPPKSILEDITQWISVRKSFLVGKDVGQPATLSLTYFGGADETREAGRPRTVFDVRGALALRLLEDEREFGRWTLQWRPTAVIEADVSTDKKVGRDKIVHRLGADGILFETEPTRAWTGHNFAVTFDYTTDRQYRSAVIGGTAQYSPNILPIGIGRALESGSFQFAWRPYLGLTAGAVEDDGGKKTLKDMGSYIDAYLRIAADLAIGSRFHLTPEVTWFQELQNRRRSHALISLGARYVLDADGRFSVTAAYTRGQESPEFVDQDQLTFGLGIKF